MNLVRGVRRNLVATTTSADCDKERLHFNKEIVLNFGVTLSVGYLLEPKRCMTYAVQS